MNRQDVIYHLQIIRTWAAVGKDPIYHGIEPKCCEDVERWIDDALELLKEQEAKPPEWHIGRAHCPECGELFPKKKEREINYCFQCGQAVKWDG